MTDLAFNKNFKKLFFDIRFKPRLDFFSKAFDFAQTLTEDYPNWETDQSKIILRNNEKFSLVSFTHDRMIFTFEGDNINMEDISANFQIIKEHLKYFGIQEITRTGARLRTYRETTMSFPELVQAFHFKVYSQEVHQAKYFGSSTQDDSLVIVSNHEDWTYNFQIGPVKQLELLQRLGLQVAKPTLDKLPQVSIFTDVDAYQNKVFTTNDDSIISKVEENLQKLVEASTFALDLVLPKK